MDRGAVNRTEQQLVPGNETAASHDLSANLSDNYRLHEACHFFRHIFGHIRAENAQKLRSFAQFSWAVTQI